MPKRRAAERTAMELKKAVYENGVYRWRCETGDEFKQYESRLGIRMAVGICLFLMTVGMMVLKDIELILMFLTCGIVILIALVTGRYVLTRPGNETVPYELRKDYIRIREGRGSSFVNFKRVLYTETRGNMILLHTRFSHVPVYIPEEDFEVISGEIIKNSQFRIHNS